MNISWPQCHDHDRDHDRDRDRDRDTIQLWPWPWRLRTVKPTRGLFFAWEACVDPTKRFHVFLHDLEVNRIDQQKSKMWRRLLAVPLSVYTKKKQIKSALTMIVDHTGQISNSAEKKRLLLCSNKNVSITKEYSPLGFQRGRMYVCMYVCASSTTDGVP
jgi:hypothetical protein